MTAARISTLAISKASRYGPKSAAVVDEVRVAFRVAQRGVAPGQSVVIYRGDELLGGARILRAVR